MQIQNISFGQKIPRAKVNIQNKTTKEFIPATVYEYDCKDQGDYKTIRNLTPHWYYNGIISEEMQAKYEVLNKFHSRSDNSFYVLENQEQEILGIAEVSSTNGIYDLTFLESKRHNPYKYVGQTMLAAIGNEILKKDGLGFIISCALDEAMDFYTQKCGFKLFGNSMLRMNHKDIQEFKDRTEEKTKSQIGN